MRMQDRRKAEAESEEEEENQSWTKYLGAHFHWFLPWFPRGWGKHQHLELHRLVRCPARFHGSVVRRWGYFTGHPDAIYVDCLDREDGQITIDTVIWEKQLKMTRNLCFTAPKISLFCGLSCCEVSALPGPRTRPRIWQDAVQSPGPGRN